MASSPAINQALRETLDRSEKNSRASGRPELADSKVLMNGTLVYCSYLNG